MLQSMGSQRVRYDLVIEQGYYWCFDNILTGGSLGFSVFCFHSKIYLFESQDSKDSIIINVGREWEEFTCVSGKLWCHLILSGGFWWCFCLGWYFLQRKLWICWSGWTLTQCTVGWEEADVAEEMKVMLNWHHQNCPAEWMASCLTSWDELASSSSFISGD